MNGQARWLNATIGVFSVIGIIAVLVTGVLGMRALIHYARQNPPDGETASIGVPPPEAPVPPPGNALPPPSGVVVQPPRVIPPGSQPPPLPGGVADLAVEIVDTGILSGGPNGAFQSAASVRASDYPAILFDVVNIGTAVSERWEFSATLPTYGGFFSSETQQRLAPGDRIRYTLGFRPISASSASGGAVAVITVDPTNRLADRNRRNDFATTTFTLIP